MSAATARKKNQPALATSGRGAAFCVTFGIVSITLGAAWLLSLLFDRESYVLRELCRALMGLAGPLCWGLPFLFIWGGVKLLVSTRHAVGARNFLIVGALYWLALAFCALLTRVSTSSGLQSYMEYVGRQSYQSMLSGYDGMGAYLHQAYALRSMGGGMIGMLLAFPVWKGLGLIGGCLLIAAAMIVLLFLLLRLNPGDLFRTVSDKSEARRAAQERKRREREQTKKAKEEAEAGVFSADAPPLQAFPMEPVRPAQTVAREETICDAPEYYQPAPLYDTQPAPVSPPPQEEAFYPVRPDLYDERFPLHDAPVPAMDQPAPVSPPQEEVAARPADVPASPDAPAPTAQATDEDEYFSQPRQPASIPQPPTAMPRDTRRATAAPAPKPPETRPAETVLDDDPPWDEPETPVRLPSEQPGVRPKAAKDKPVVREYAAPAPAPKPQSDWVSQVRRREAELAMPEHTTAKGDPKPVYTDPVMPITGERIAIAPKAAPAQSAQTKLDGTTPPTIHQSKMPLSAPYTPPPIRLLKEMRHVPQQDAAQEDERKAQIIEGTLRSFGVESEVKQIMHGPAITRFAIQIAPGVKVSRVANTADNLALELKSKHVRVEAPIQGTNYIGIEVPNALISPVSLREVLDSPEMRANPSPLVVALGKDIAGAPILCDLSKMPHLLIAGATGSGKSVCINSIVCSLLYRTSPEQVRLIMIDPKQVELSVYNNIPHLLVPVVSDPRKASGALAWVVQEMLERYGKFSAQNVRNLSGYNKVNQGTDKVLPNIVVVIDEMADLMEVCRKDVEESIRRLAALARAAGIYMVLATQRPSVDVITGVIKNNIPSRIAFAVSSGTDSRTIIDINGAEKLMGKGDMLYKPAGTSPLRVQGCLVTDDEVNAITEFIASRYQTDYDPNIIEHLDSAGKEQNAPDEIGGEDEPDAAHDGIDDLLREAIEMAIEDGQASTSMLQRRLRVGYARAGRLIDEMEKRGIVSQSEGSKPRKTLITREQYYDLFRDE